MKENRRKEDRIYLHSFCKVFAVIASTFFFVCDENSSKQLRWPNICPFFYCLFVRPSTVQIRGAVKDVVDKATTKEVYASVILSVWDLMNAVQTLKASVPQRTHAKDAVGNLLTEAIHVTVILSVPHIISAVLIMRASVWLKNPPMKICPTMKN